MKVVFYPICLLLIVLFFSSFNTGVGKAILSGKSDSGRTIFKAEMEDCRILENAELTIDKAKLTFSAEDNGHIVADLENGVFTMHLESGNNGGKFLRLWAIPSSFKNILNEKGSGSQFHKVYEFKVKFYSTEPRKGKGFNTPEIEIYCTLDFQL